MAAAAKLKLGDSVQGHTYMGGDPNNQASWVDLDTLTNSGKSGDAFLSDLQRINPSLVNTVKALSEGRQSIPSGRVATDPYWGTAFRLAQQYDPTLDQSKYPQRQKTALDFGAGGIAAQNLRNLNQGIGHLHDLVQAIPGVAGHSGLLGLSHLLNMGQNFEADMNGDPKYTAYTVPRTALSSELASIFKGKGTSNEAEVNKFYNLLGPNGSTAQKYEAARGLASLLQSRIDELGDQYNTGFSTDKQSIHLLNPKAQKQFADIQAAGIDPSQVQPTAAPDVDPKTAALLQKYKIPGYVNGTP